MRNVYIIKKRDDADKFLNYVNSTFGYPRNGAKFYSRFLEKWDDQTLVAILIDDEVAELVKSEKKYSIEQLKQLGGYKAFVYAGEESKDTDKVKINKNK